MPPPVAILDRDEDLDELERRIIAGADVANRSWSDYLLCADRAARHADAGRQPGSRRS